MKKVLVATAALAAWVSAGFGGIGVNWTAGGRVYGVDGKRGIAADGAVVWQLIYAGPDGVAEPVDWGAADGVGGDDVLLAVRYVPAGGGVASDGTEWNECLEKLAGDSVYEDTGWWSAGGCFVYQRIYQNADGPYNPGDAYYQSGLFRLQMTYDGWGPASLPDVFGAAAGVPDGAVAASFPPPPIPEDRIDWCEDTGWPDGGSWKDDAWSNGDWHLEEVGETHVTGLYTWSCDQNPTISLWVEPNDGTIGLSPCTLDLEDGVAMFEVTLLKEPPADGAAYTIRARAGNGWPSITHLVTVGNLPVTWQYEVTDGSAVITGAVPARGNLVVPEELGGHPVTGIGPFAFYDCNGLASVTIPGTVTNIGGCAFCNCSGLETLSVPASWEGTSMLDAAGVPDGCTIVYRTPPEEETTSTGVPYTWIDENAADILAANGGDHEAAAKAPAANGRPVWECYVAGLSPADPAAAFKIKSITVTNGGVAVEWEPDLGADRSYVVEGKASMADEWGPRGTDSRFFRAKVVVGEEPPEPPAPAPAHTGVQLWQDGPYWAETNIGAESPEDYGLYFWWGDTVGYRREGGAWVASDGSTANFSFDEANTPTYRKDNATLQSEGWITAERALAPEHDAAQVHWGGGWRMPTDAEFADLIANTTTTWTTSNGVHGRLVTGKGEFASASIFLPAAGDGYGTSLELSGSYGDYWSSTPYSSYSTDARYLQFYSGDFARYNGSPRLTGQSVRALRGFAE